MIVTLMCANLIIRKIYKDGSPSVKVALSQHYNGSERPCKRFLRVRIYNNDACYSCPYACNMRVSDITLGDFWGIKEELPEFFEENALTDETSVSAVMINTLRGQQIYQKIKDYVISKSVDYEKVTRHNPQLNKPAYCERNIRQDLYDGYEINGYETVEKFYRQYSDYRKYSLRISCYIPVALKRVIKKIMRLRRQQK